MSLFSFKSKQIISTDKQKIHEILTRGIEDVFVKESLEKKLLSGKQLRVKLGFDPTGGRIHIGRAILLRKLKAFQDLGHKVVFIVGDFTAQIGDPSDKIEKRPMLTREKIEENIKDYKRQVGKIIDVSKAEFHFNSTWLSKLGFQEIAELAETFSVQQMSSRRNFKDRFEKGVEVSLREFLYPLMQGYDSVQVKADIEIGGFDQLFNLKAGRIIQKYYKQPEQDVLTIQMLEGTDGRKMSTSWGNIITILDTPEEMYGKLMSTKDELLPQYFLLCTDLSKEEITKALDGVHPKEAKMHLAREVVALYHPRESVQKAEQDFIKTFSKGGVPENTPEVTVEAGTKLSDILLDAKLVSSKTEFKRLAEEGGVKNIETEKALTDIHEVVTESITLKIGKRRFLKINIK